jgi:hypothetical protein
MPIGTQVHMVKKHFTDGWGHEWFEGGYILQGLRYERLCPHNRSYYLLGDPHLHMCTPIWLWLPNLQCHLQHMQ